MGEAIGVQGLSPCPMGEAIGAQGLSPCPTGGAIEKRSDPTLPAHVGSLLLCLEVKFHGTTSLSLDFFRR
jgi:hypothetical protein